MAVTAVNLARVSFNQQAYNLREAMRLNQTGLYRAQNGLTTGRRFLQPSEDPLRAAQSDILDRRLERLTQAANNIRAANGVLSESESAAADAVAALREVQQLALSAVGDTMTADERQALTTVVAATLNQLVTLGNRRHQNTYLFSGQVDRAPFEFARGGVLYTGDGNRLETVVEGDGSAATFTVPGVELFHAVSRTVRGHDLDPALTRDTRVTDLDGAAGRGVQLGRIVVTVGDDQRTVDLRGAATVGDILDRLNAALPTGLTASLGPRGIILSQGRPQRVTIADVAGSRAAVDLGLAGTFDQTILTGADLHPRLTLWTRIRDLRGGLGLDLRGGLVVRSGAQTATVNFDQAETIEDVLNAINRTDLGVWARISADGRSLEVVNRLSGVDLYLEEGSGQAASLLGLRTLRPDTRLAELNDGRGVQTVEGADLRITTASGAQIDVDLDGAVTMQDVIERLNAAGAGRIVAGLRTSGNGLQITDQTVGAETFRVEALNSSPALADLGLDVTATGNQLQGRDVNPVRVDSPFTALLELQRGLQADERLTIQTAAERLERTLTGMLRVQGQIASQARAMEERGERVATETDAAQTLLSDVRDVDLTEATLRFQQLQTALQANLLTASKLLNLSLLDLLR